MIAIGIAHRNGSCRNRVPRWRPSGLETLRGFGWVPKALYSWVVAYLVQIWFPVMYSKERMSCGPLTRAESPTALAPSSALVNGNRLCDAVPQACILPTGIMVMHPASIIITCAELIFQSVNLIGMERYSYLQEQTAVVTRPFGSRHRSIKPACSKILDWVEASLHGTLNS